LLIDIERIREYYNNGAVYTTGHADLRFRQRGIKAKDIRNVVMTGEIIEQYPNDKPFPSCLIMGKSVSGRVIHTVISDEGSCSGFITAYYPDEDIWEDDYKTRKENAK
jgi:hypothetical protein